MVQAEQSTGSERIPEPVGPPRPPVWVQDLTAAAFVIALTFVADPLREYVPPNGVMIGASLLAAVLLPLRRRCPIPLVGVTVALFIAVAVFERSLNAGLELATAIAVFGAGTRRGLRTSISVTFVSIVLAVCAASWATGSLLDPRMPQLVFVIAFAGAAGDATRMHREYIAAIQERAVRAEETKEAEAKRRVTEERLRIARDLHDAVAHEISVISLNAGVASQTIDVDPAQARESLATVRSAGRTVLGEIGALLELLRTEEPASGADGISATAPQPTLDRLDDLIARFSSAGLAVSTRVEGDTARVPDSAGRVAYRVVQEALTNAYKHGAERRAHVLVNAREDHLDIVVTNPVSRSPAQAADPLVPGDDALNRRTGFGITGLRERVASARGSVETGLVAGGWRLAATLPIPPAPGDGGTAE